MRTISVIALALGLFVMSSCSRDKADEQLKSGEVKQYEFLDASAFDTWTYFSFEKGKIVEVSDFKNDSNWDIAFHRGDIRLNGGASGKGLAEAINTGKKEWSSVVSAPATGYGKDGIGKIVVSYSRGGVVQDDQPFSQVMANWLTIDTKNHPPKYTVNNWVYVIKTATGKPVKIQIYDNKNEKGRAGHFSFKYQYNASGSTKF